MNILPDQKTVACLVRLLKEAGGDRGRQGETGVDGINVRLSFL